MFRNRLYNNSKNKNLQEVKILKQMTGGKTKGINLFQYLKPEKQ